MLCCAVCLAGSGRAAERPGWLVVGPWDGKIEGGIGGPESTLGAVVTKLRITIDLDQPPPFAGGGPIPAIDFPPIVKSVRMEGGELVLKRGGQTQTLSWRGEFSQASPGFWEGTLAATGAGTEVTATINYRAMERTWRVPALALRLDLAAWSALVLPAFLPKNMEWTCGGTARLEGALAWTPGGLDGAMALTLQDGRASSTDGGISVEGIEGVFKLVSLASLASAPDQRFTARAFTAGKVRLTNLVAATTLHAADRMTARIDGEGLGGRLAVEPFEFNPTEIRYTLNVRLDDIDAQPILAMFPTVPQGTGKLVGQVPVSWMNGLLGLGAGRLVLKEGSTGRVRFHNPGLLTQWWHWFIPGRKLAGRIESGTEELVISDLSIILHPPGAPAERAAVIHLKGVPADHPEQGPYTFDFNVNAPLENFINLGMKQDMIFDFK